MNLAVSRGAYSLVLGAGRVRERSVNIAVCVDSCVCKLICSPIVYLTPCHQNWDSDWLWAALPIGQSSSPRMDKIFCSPRRPVCFWGSPSLLFNGYGGLQG
jgi:hypothetical protein